MPRNHRLILSKNGGNNNHSKKYKAVNMTHKINLLDEPFEKIKNGSKTIELRLHDEKRRKIKVGDTVCFKSKTDKLTATVKAVHIFKNFEELYAALPLNKCGYSADELATASPDDMLVYYTKEQIEKHGVVGIEIEVI